MQNKINIIALVAGIFTLVLVAVSLFVPWWQFSMGTNPGLAVIKVSPVNISISVLSTPLTIPILWAVTIAGALTLVSGAIVLLIYSVQPNKSYSMKLLSFGYKKPLTEVIIFIVSLLCVSLSVQSFAGFGIPLVGTGSMVLPEGLTQGENVSVSVAAGFEWPFYFAIVVAALCIAARLYHKKVVKADTNLPPPPPPPITQ